MSPRARSEIDALREMTPTQLREKYEQLTGEPTRCGNKPYLIRRIAWRIQASEEGSLPERIRQQAIELADEADLRLTPMKQPSRRDDTHEIRSTVHSPSGGAMKPGTELVREYKGRTIRVRVVDASSYEFEQKRYSSLSAVAKAVTGAHWNGRLFFGLKPARQIPQKWNDA